MGHQSKADMGVANVDVGVMTGGFGSVGNCRNKRYCSRKITEFPLSNKFSRLKFP